MKKTFKSIKRILVSPLLFACLLTACHNSTNEDRDLGTQSATDGGSNRALRTDTANTRDTGSVVTPEH